jgi:hypothetical protein
VFTFKVVPDNGDPYEVTAGSRDVLTWEKSGKGRNVSKFRESMEMADLYRLAHIASRRLGLYAGDLREFEESVEIDLSEEDQEPDPTRPAR